MSKRVNAHVGVMFLLSLGIAYFVVRMLPTGGSDAYSIGVVFGRALGTVLIPLLLLAIPAGLYRLIKKKPMPRYLGTLWVLWFVILLLSTYGSLIAS